MFITKFARYCKAWQTVITNCVTYYKVLQVLQSVTDCCYKVSQVFQSVTGCYYKVCQVLQSVTVITKRDVTAFPKIKIFSILAKSSSKIEIELFPMIVSTLTITIMITESDLSHLFGYRNSRRQVFSQKNSRLSPFWVKLESWRVPAK